MTTTNTAATLTAVLREAYQVTTTDQGWIEVRVNPATALRDKLDFARIAEDDGTYRLIHLTHNGVCKGEATFSNSMVGYLPTLVREFCESQF